MASLIDKGGINTPTSMGIIRFYSPAGGSKFVLRM